MDPDSRLKITPLPAGCPRATPDQGVQHPEQQEHPAPPARRPGPRLTATICLTPRGFVLAKIRPGEVTLDHGYDCTRLYPISG
jgi:hypothetical protein